MSDDTRPMSGVPTLLAGRYRLLGSIGQGGMADVQRAYDEQLDREIAVKILHARYADDPNFLMRFRREARSAASLNHPNIVSVYDAGETNGRPFIVMELVRGRSLRQLTRVERISAARTVEIVGDAALALNYAHEHGLIHRDIKPGNILISNDGEVKVTDFGIARAVNAETITETAAVFGTAAYVSPEQAQGESVDQRSDVYSLGCVLYELLSGQQPFHADSPVALAYQHVSTVPRPPSELSDESTPELDAITMKAMAKKVGDRYQTARELNADLERARAGVPVTAPMVSAYGATQVADRWDERTVVSSGAPAQPTQGYDDSDPYYDEPYYDDEEQGNRTGWIVASIVLLLLLLLGGWWLFTNLGAEEVQTATLPDVVGSSPQDARDALGALGFENVQIQNTQRSGEQENTVIAQDPEPTADEIPVDTEIVLTVNTTAPLVAVPDVVGKTVPEARRELQEANLEVSVERVPNDAPANEVLSTNPSAETEVREGTEVRIVASSGPNQAAVPNVVDRTEDDAIGELAAACEPQPCFGAFVTREFSDAVDEGRVISQNPSAGTEAEIGEDVTIVVSRGPENVEPSPPPAPEMTTVPDIVGLQEEPALVLLQAAGLEVGEVSEEPSDTVAEGLVIRTNPEADQEVEEGTTVGIVVSSGPDDS